MSFRRKLDRLSCVGYLTEPEPVVGGELCLPTLTVSLVAVFEDLEKLGAALLGIRPLQCHFARRAEPIVDKVVGLSELCERYMTLLVLHVFLTVTELLLNFELS